MKRIALTLVVLLGMPSVVYAQQTQQGQTSAKQQPAQVAQAPTVTRAVVGQPETAGIGALGAVNTGIVILGASIAGVMASGTDSSGAGTTHHQ